MQNPDADMEKYFIELQKVCNRGYTTGFALGENMPDSYSYDISKGLAGADFLFEFHGKKKYSDVVCHSELDSESDMTQTLKQVQGDDCNLYFVKVKNKIYLNDEVEIITPDEQFITKVVEIVDEKGENLDLANTNADVYLKLSVEPKDYEVALARTIGVKEHVC
jgi:vacuolar-type H+-ATPase subunit I/STV1